jgi:hypothetical protein
MMKEDGGAREMNYDGKRAAIQEGNGEKAKGERGKGKGQNRPDTRF